MAAPPKTPEIPKAVAAELSVGVGSRETNVFIAVQMDPSRTPTDPPTIAPARACSTKPKDAAAKAPKPAPPIPASRVTPKIVAATFCQLLEPSKVGWSVESSETVKTTDFFKSLS